jgi:hypothetical protein
LKKANGGALEVPFLMVGTKSVRGFDEARYASALDGAGYPKSSLAGLGTKPTQSKTANPVAKPADPAVSESAGTPATKDAEQAGRNMAQLLASDVDLF